MGEAPVIEDPAFCLCGKKRKKNEKGLLYCPNCDRPQKSERTEKFRTLTGPDEVFHTRSQQQMLEWYPDQDLTADVDDLYQKSS